MPALIFNIYLNTLEKFEVFKITYTDIHDLFDEKHIKIRGKYNQLAYEYINKISKDFITYRELPNKDWINAFSIMVNNIKSRSAFIYLEDHKLIKDKNYFKKILIDFDKLRLDYLCYSWFYSSQIYLNNLLPLSPEHKENLAFLNLNEDKFSQLKENSGDNFYSFSLCSLVSVKNLKKIITQSFIANILQL